MQAQAESHLGSAHYFEQFKKRRSYLGSYPSALSEPSALQPVQGWWLLIKATYRSSRFRSYCAGPQLSVSHQFPSSQNIELNSPSHPEPLANGADDSHTGFASTRSASGYVRRVQKTSKRADASTELRYTRNYDGMILIFFVAYTSTA
jgi:hypothetical protein